MRASGSAGSVFHGLYVGAALDCAEGKADCASGKTEDDGQQGRAALAEPRAGLHLRPGSHILRPP